MEAQAKILTSFTKQVDDVQNSVQLLLLCVPFKMSTTRQKVINSRFLFLKLTNYVLLVEDKNIAVVYVSITSYIRKFKCDPEYSKFWKLLCKRQNKTTVRKAKYNSPLQ